MDLTIRTARREDLPAILALYVHLNPANACLPDDNDVERVWEQLRDDPRLTCFVVEADGVVVGTATLAVIPNLTHGARPFAVIENVVTHADFRGQGTGKRLMRHVLATAWERDCYKVMLMSGVYRQEAHRFYESLGFTRDTKVAFVATPESTEGFLPQHKK